MADKAFRDMTDAELRAEHDKWDSKIRNSTGWGEPRCTSTRCGDFEAKIMGNYIALSPAYLAVLLDFVPMLAESLNDQQRVKP